MLVVVGFCVSECQVLFGVYKICIMFLLFLGLIITDIVFILANLVYLRICMFVYNNVILQ